ncbi:MAG TPA: hypothetical protein VFS39_08475 [Nitrospira sp.]|nr:hypothetical protein [Nitrospira sp.]
MLIAMRIYSLAAVLAAASVAGAAAGAEVTEKELHEVSGTLSKLDLSSGRGLLTTDLGRPIHFEVPKAYLFENVTVGARIALQLDEYGRAVKVMDSSVPDLIGPQNGEEHRRPLAAGSDDGARP